MIRAAIHTLALTRKDLCWLLNRLVDTNERILRTRGIRYAPLYQSGVRYQPETEDYGNPHPREDFYAIDTLYPRGFGDCEDLACARVAELRVRGIKAFPRLTQVGNMYHVTVRIGAGKNSTIEDPSRVLGMKGPA